MTKQCDLTGKSVMTGNNVSHANNKTKRRFLPNLQHKSVWSQALNRAVSLRLTTNALRTVEKNGGLDGYLTTTSNSKLSPEMLKLKKAILKAAA